MLVKGLFVYSKPNMLLWTCSSFSNYVTQSFGSQYGHTPLSLEPSCWAGGEPVTHVPVAALVLSWPSTKQSLESNRLLDHAPLGPLAGFVSWEASPFNDTLWMVCSVLLLSLTLQLRSTQKEQRCEVDGSTWSFHSQSLGKCPATGSEPLTSACSRPAVRFSLGEGGLKYFLLPCPAVRGKRFPAPHTSQPTWIGIVLPL